MSDTPGAPQLGLDELLTELIDRAHDVRHAHDWLRALLSANRSIIGELTLPMVLRRVVDSARELVGARYGALGVIDPRGSGLQAFVWSGMDEQAAARIGALPTGKGLLGALIEQRRAIRLDRIADDPRSSGFPDHHPPMSAFLGVPIAVRGAAYGNLYLTEPASGRFTADDEEVVSALAVTAGVAIENARLFERAEQRQRWLRASTEITTQLLSQEGEDPLHLIARSARELAGAALVTVVLPMPGGDRLMVEVASAEEPVHLAGHSFPAEGTLSWQAISTGRPVTVDDAQQYSEVRIHLLDGLAVGPVMVLPLTADGSVRGALSLGRRPGAEPFDDDDIDMATTFANHASVALALADARAAEQRVLLLEDRDRIARDLHDHVIQRLFAAGLTLDGMAAALSEEKALRLAGVIDEIDETIRQIRTTIFELRGHLSVSTAPVRTQLLDVVAEVRPLLAAEPTVRLDGPIDTVIPDAVVDDLLAVLRETLTNIARHAHADSVDITLEAAPEAVSLEVADNGVGIGASTRRSGLANLRERAEKHGGTLSVGPIGSAHSMSSRTSGPGTLIKWMVPLS